MIDVTQLLTSKFINNVNDLKNTTNEIFKDLDEMIAAEKSYAEVREKMNECENQLIEQMNE